MKSITFKRRVIKTEEIFELVVLNLEDNQKYLELKGKYDNKGCYSLG